MIKYHSSLIFTNNKIFSNEVELFVNLRRTTFSLDFLYSSETHFQLVDSKQKCCMIFLGAKQPRNYIVFSSEVYVRTLTNETVLTSNDLLCMSGEYGLSTMHKEHNLFLDSGINFIRAFDFDMCKVLSAFSLVSLLENFVSNVDYLPETFKIINKPYLEYR